MNRLVWLPIALVALIVVLLPLAAVSEAPIETEIKEWLSIGPPSCGPIIARGRPGAWRREREMPSLRDGPSAAIVGGKGHFIGGIASFNDEGTVAESVRTHEAFDFETNRYEHLPPLPRPLNHVAVAAWNGNLYAVGGLGDDLENYIATGEAWRYDVRERRWLPIAPMPTPRGAAGAAVVDDVLYVVGGLANGERLTNLEAYDLKRDRWYALPQMETRRDHLGVATRGKYLYALGGRQEDERPLTDFERYDIESRRWERLPALPEPTAGFGFVSADGRLIAAGGEDLPPRVLFGRVWEYRPGERTWSALPSMSEPKHGFAMLTHDRRVYAFGGSRCSGFKPTRSVESLRLLES